MSDIIRTLLAIVAAFAASVAGPAAGEPWPTRPVHLMIPFPPGGAADIMARVLADEMSTSLGQPVIVDNKPGAGATLAYQAAARAAPDGYTVLQVWPSFVVNPIVRSGLNYDPLRDFRPVIHAISLPLALAVNPSIPVRTLDELVQLARTRPGELSYSTPGLGTTQNILGEMLNVAGGVKIQHVPYPGGGQNVMAVAGGHVTAVIANVTEIAPQAQPGKIRALVVFSAERVDALPDVPSIRETSYPQLETVNWAGYVVPAQTPIAIVTRLHAELAKALKQPSVREKLKAQGMYSVPGTPEQFGAFLQSESARYAKVVKEAGIKID
jgi:tripartite-type tricarboxylate transporter receptor subunit TctC